MCAQPLPDLTAELETALIHELLQSHRQLNWLYFKNKLRPVTMWLSSSETHLGLYRSDVASIEVSRALVLGQPWGVVLEVLKHEMAHQYVYETLGITDETAHGPAFQRVCAELGIDAAAAGLPRAPDGAESEKVIERVARLLSLAKSDNPHEADAAMAAARRLMLKHNLDQDRLQRPDYSFRTLGRPMARVHEAARFVGTILSRHFFVEVLWVSSYLPLEGKRGSVIEIGGSTANLEMAAYVHDFLHHTAEALWRRHKAERGIRGNRERRTFVSGVMRGFFEKLEAERRATEREGLVWLKDASLSDYWARRHPRTHQIRYQGSARSAAHDEGRAAGRSIELHRPITGGGGVRLLPGKG